MSRRQIAQELECNFNASGETVIHPDDIMRIDENITPPKHRTGFDRNFWIWEEYNAENTYLLSADVARGDGHDYSVFHIFKLETMEIIAEYQGKVTPDMFSEIVLSAGKEYGNCMVVIENNSVGFAVIEKLKEKEYPNVYHSVKSTHEYVDQLTAENRSGTVAGFTTSLKTRPLLVAKFEEFIRNKILTIYSSRIRSELDVFIWNNGRPEAQRGYNDDLVMACAIGCWVRDTAIIENQRDVAFKKAMLGSIIRSDSVLDTSIPGMLGRSKSRELDIKKTEAEKQYEKHSWLLKG
jgi:hypothetical protein